MAKCDMCGMEIPEGKEVKKEGKTLCPMCAEKKKHSMMGGCCH